MSSRERCSSPRAALHLTAGGIDGAPIFLNDYDRFEFVLLLRRVTDKCGWTVLAWCLMDTHYHLLVIAPDEPRVPWAMQWLNGHYARRFNVRHGRRGHLFGARYSETVIADDRHLQAANDYILENPVRAGLIRLATDWPWSGDGRLDPRDVEEVVRLRPQKRDVLVRSHG